MINPLSLYIEQTTQPQVPAAPVSQMSIGGSRPLISFNGKILHNGIVCKVLMKKDLICVGCTGVTPEALEYLMNEYKKIYKTPSVVILQS